jgi:GntR family phosphonate transport system transcriptional regulator
MYVYAISRGEGSVPVYRQIALWLRKEVSDNYLPGDILPSEIELSKRLGVNRHTLRRGVDELVSKGFVERRHGVGIIVLEKAHNYSINAQSRFTEAKKLGIGSGAQIIHLETLRIVEKKPFCLISHFLCFDDFSIVLDEFRGGSLHSFLKKNLSIKLEREESLVSTALPTFEDATQLLMPKSEPVLKSKSVNVEITTGRPIEYAITRFRGGTTELTFNF